MSKTNTDQPAFPTTVRDSYDPETGAQWSDHINPGMTLRDYFAAKAMQGNLASMVEGQEFNPSMGAEWVYKVADAMLSARGTEKAREA
jgi:hypothetical protein